MTPPVLSVKNLNVIADAGSSHLALIDDVSFDLRRGEILGLVGESGSGKSMTCRALMRLLPSKQISISKGSAVLQNGVDLLALSDAEMRKMRGRAIGMIFQNPSSHLDPVMSIGGQLIESLRYHKGLSHAEARREGIGLLEQVGIPAAERRMSNFAHEFSGGMRQRAMIAIALSSDPKILIADEPTTALDVTVQIQILRLLLKLRNERDLSIIFITHDLGVVAQLCDSVAVLYGGRLCELGSKIDVIGAPRHPYTAGLVACQPSSGTASGRVRTIPGQPPRAAALPTGCRFHPRCEHASEECAVNAPKFISDGAGRVLACHHPLGPKILEVQ